MDSVHTHTLTDLGTLVDIFMRGGHPGAAQVYLNEMQERITAAMPKKGPPPLVEVLGDSHPGPTKTLVKIVQETKEAAEVETSEPTSVAPEPEGPPRDAQGNVTRISTQPGDPGYDPDVHENLDLKIFCKGQHIPTAHTADVAAGTVWFYRKNEQGRIKTLTVHGEVRIEGLSPEIRG